MTASALAPAICFMSQESVTARNVEGVEVTAGDFRWRWPHRPRGPPNQACESERQWERSDHRDARLERPAGKDTKRRQKDDRRCIERTKASSRLRWSGCRARGKTYIARKVVCYLSWLGHETRSFNVGSYRRAQLGQHHAHEFFSPENAEGRAALLSLALTALDDMTSYLETSGEVAVFDATNSTRARRKLVTDRFVELGIPLVSSNPSATIRRSSKRISGRRSSVRPIT